MEKALLKEETKRNLIFHEFQKLRKEIRVMCRIRPPNAEDGIALLDYKTSEGKFHSKPAGLEIISQRGRFGTTTQVSDSTKHYNFDRVFEAQETNEDVWFEIGQFVQSFVEGRQVTIFCYGQTATGKTYTMSNSDHAINEDGDPILTNEGIMPRSKALIFEEADRRREKGWSVAIRGCCYEVYLKEIRLLLPNNVVKTKTLNPAEPPWWHVRETEHQSLNSIEDFDRMFESAMESRTFAATTSNSNSSRSHFILYLEFEAKSPTMRKAVKGNLCLVDLAGSEDPHKASALDDQNIPRGGNGAGLSEDAEKKRVREQRLREGIAINQSLRVLKQSISKIRNPTAPNGKPTLEGGDEESSTLAKLLGPCLGRESMVLMFVMISLRADCLTETKATLESGKEVSAI
ncbi:P-loop containing nucleoside triphosphate hydrolase protein [Nemania abortiva]|nr:P-loop containing nucleoside triphosphate hydrolase protein [Nemania abortiva]